MKILTADDDASSRAILTSALKSFGHEVVETNDGIEAWSQYRLHNFQLIVSDWMMPELDGVEFCRRVRSEPKAKYTYIILLTSLEGKQKYLEGMEAGADDFINKPFDRDTLAARIRVAERILGLQAEVKQLEGLLPICSYCKKIKDDDNHWQNMESYISRRTEANFSHGICPDCYQKYMVPQLQQYEKAKQTEIPMAIDIIKRSQFFLLVLDEDADEAKALSDGGVITSETLQLVQHFARVVIVNLKTDKTLVRVRRSGNAKTVLSGAITDPETRDAVKRQVNNCGLAGSVWADINPPKREAAGDGGVTDGGHR